MRPVVVTAVLLLVVLMSMSASAEWTPDLLCRTKFPSNNCRKNLGPRWFQFGSNRCVKAFNNMRLAHSDAKKHCRTFSNGDLVSIHSVEELVQVECAMYRVMIARAQYWIGLYWARPNFIYATKYVWTDGTKHDYSHWARGQPDSHALKPEHCVEMNYGGWGLWNDENCQSKRLFVCQAKI